MYEKLLTNPDEKVEGTVKELADKYGLTILEMAGFLDGINDSLVKDNPIETMDENTRVNLVFDKEKLYKNMVDAKADWLYNLPMWDDIFDKETKHRLYMEQKKSGTVIVGKRWDVMIRVHAAVERNTNSAVERINKFQILKYKFPVSEN